MRDEEENEVDGDSIVKEPYHAYDEEKKKGMLFLTTINMLA